MIQYSPISSSKGGSGLAGAIAQELGSAGDKGHLPRVFLSQISPCVLAGVVLVGLALGRVAELRDHESGIVAADDLGIDGPERRLQILPLLALEVLRGAHEEADHDACERA